MFADLSAKDAVFMMTLAIKTQTMFKMIYNFIFKTALVKCLKVSIVKWGICKN